LPELSQRLRDALSDRYRIERELGRGGMATVFLAEDLRHHRQVAIKVLDPEVAAAVGSERFLREIETVARLTHPHILPLHDSGQAGGLLYYVMPHVAGESLRQRLEREKQLPVEEALRLAREVADALAYAHRQGVVHRDIKPENVLLEEGHALVADFGIARAVAGAGGEKLTATGVSVGTPAYMSPEQAAGGRDVDGRSDLYSLGCVLYEMLAGEAPFTGPTAESLVHQHLNVTPRPVTELRTSVPMPAAAALQRALAKTPADRYTTTGEFAAALAAPAHPGAAPAAASRLRGRGRRAMIGASIVAAVALIAAGAWLGWGPLARRLGLGKAPPSSTRDWILVADFDAPDSSLGAAVRDLVSTALDQSSLVACMSRYQVAEVLEASGRPRGMRVDAELARELAYRSGVRAVVEGRVAQLGRGYTLTVRVLDADSTRVITTATETARNEDGLIRAADGIGRRLRRALGENQAAIRGSGRIWLMRTPSFEAVRLMRLANRSEFAGDYSAARAWARRAIQLDPEFAVAWRAMGVWGSNLGDVDSALFCYRRALSFPQRMTEGDRLRTEAHIASNQDDPATSLALWERARAIDPIYGQMNRGWLLETFGRWEEALAVYRWTRSLPGLGRSQPAANNEWLCLLSLGRTEEAISVSRLISVPTGDHSVAAVNALVTARWAQAESLGTLTLDNPQIESGSRSSGGSIAAGAQCARGSIAGARTTLRRVLSIPELTSGSREDALLVWLLIDVVTGRPRDPINGPGPRDTSETWQVQRALRLAVAGDALLAQAVLRALEPRRPTWTMRVRRTLAQGLIDSRAHRYQQVVEGLGPAARTRMFEGRVLPGVMPYAYRWLVSRAWESLGQPDSAVVYCALALEPSLGSDDLFVGHPIALPFVLQRLVLLETRLGRLDGARRHWQALDSLATKPDTEFRPLLAEARQALASAEAMARSTRR